MNTWKRDPRTEHNRSTNLTTGLEPHPQSEQSGSCIQVQAKDHRHPSGSIAWWTGMKPKGTVPAGRNALNRDDGQDPVKTGRQFIAGPGVRARAL